MYTSMAQKESILILVTKLCEQVLADDKLKDKDGIFITKPRDRNWPQRVRKLKRRVFSIVLKLNNSGLFSRSFYQGCLSEVDQVLAIIYQMRMAGQLDSANKLESCLEKLKEKDGKFSDDIKSALQFLISLSQDYNSSASSQFLVPLVIQNKNETCILPNRPLNYGESRVFGSNSQYFMQYPQEVFEQIEKLSGISKSGDCQQNLFEVAPGFDLNGNHLFSIQGLIPEEHSKAATRPMFNALFQKDYKDNDMNVKLDIPELQEFTQYRPYEFMLTEEPSKTKLSDSLFEEDEGFNESDTPLSTSSSAGGVDDIWAAALKAKPKTHFTWETIGCSSMVREKPFLSEAGARVVDAIHHSHLHEMLLLSSSHKLPSLVKAHPTILVKDIVNMLLGIPSENFPFNEDSKTFIQREGIYIEGLTPDTVKSLISSNIQCGTEVRFLEEFATIHTGNLIVNESLIFQAFCTAVKRYLHIYRGTILAIGEQEELTLLQLNYLTQQLKNQISFLVGLCKPESDTESLRKGMQLLTLLYHYAVDNWGQDNYTLLVFLFKHACLPYLRFLQEWLFDGLCSDPFSEFPVLIDEQCLQTRDETYWLEGFKLNAPEASNKMPPFLLDLTNDIFVCGKSMSLLKICKPKNILCHNKQSRPSLKLLFFMDGIQEIQEMSRQYLTTTKSLLSLDVQVTDTSDEDQEFDDKGENEANNNLADGNKFSLPLLNIEDFRAQAGQVSSNEDAAELLENFFKGKVLDDSSSSASKLKEASVEHTSVEHHLSEDLLYSAFTNTYLKVGSKLSRQHQQSDQPEAENGLYCEASGTIMAVSKRSALGHSSDSQVKNLLYPEAPDASTADIPKLPERNPFGHASDSQLQDIIYTDSKKAPEKQVPSQNDVKSEPVEIANDLIDFSEVDGTNLPSATVAEDWENEDKDNLNLIELADEKESCRNMHNLAENLSSAKEENKVSEDVISNCSERIAEEVQVVKDDDDNRVCHSEEPIETKEDIKDVAKEVSSSANIFDETFVYSANPYKKELPLLEEDPASNSLFRLPKEYCSGQSMCYHDQSLCVDLTPGVPLPALIKQALLPPLQSQIQLVNMCSIDYFVKDLRLYEHFNALSNFFCFQDGEFGQALSQIIFDKASTCISPSSILNPSSLNSILSQALASSIKGDTREADNLSLDAKKIPSSFSHGHGILNCLVMNYKVEWPLNLIITEACLERYNKIFGFFLQIRRALWALVDVWFHLKPTGVLGRTHVSPQFKQLQLFRHEMQHFVQLVQSYISSQVLQVCLQEFWNHLNNHVHNVDDFRRAHFTFVKRMSTRCLLTKRMTPAMKIVKDIFNIVLRFRAQMVAHTWHQNPKTGEMEHPAFQHLLVSYKTFHESAALLYKALKTWEQSGSPQDCVSFSAILNFNGRFENRTLESLF